MLVTLREVLDIAEREKFAIAAFNSPTLESARAAVEAAEEMNLPIILQHAEVHFEINPIEIIGPILVDLAKRASVPVAVHLDHGSSLETVKKAVELGFSSVMIDASHKPLDENVTIVKEVVDYAHRHNVSVEAELGTLGSTGIGGEETEGSEEGSGTDGYTDPEVAQKFVKETNIDALAASFGTAHGVYITEPVLDIPRLEKIYNLTGIPVVMHGGSGLSDEEYEQTIRAGVRKINYYSYAALAGGKAVKETMEKEIHPFYHDLTIVARQAMKEDMKRVMKLFYKCQL